MTDLKVGLALSSGGVRGFAHIGVIKVLEENGIPINYISGTSAGALIGGIYASGTPIDVIEDAVVKTKIKDIVRLIDPVKLDVGLVKGNKLMAFIERLLTERKIENFKIPFAAVAVDILTGKEIIFDKGDPITAIRASISIPGVFTPVKYKKMFLIDGGVVNPLPADVVRNMGADFVIGVNAIGDPVTKVNKKQTVAFDIVVTNTIKILENELLNLKLQEMRDKNMVILKPNISYISIFSISPKSLVNSIKEGEKEANKKIDDILKVLGK